jgi:hypothetical protein
MDAMTSKKADVTVLKSNDKWIGVTYQADRPGVVQAIKALHEAGIYPATLWGTK